MDILLQTMFNGGENDGDISIDCPDGTFKAHSFVLKKFSPVIGMFILHAKEINGVITVKLDYSRMIMTAMVDSMYTTVVYEKWIEYFTPGTDKIFRQSDVNNYIKAIDQYDVKTSGNHALIRRMIVGVDMSNWCDLLISIPNDSIYAYIRAVLFRFIERKVLTAENLEVDPNPFIKFPKDHCYYDRLIGLYPRRIINESKLKRGLPNNIQGAQESDGSVPKKART